MAEQLTKQQELAIKDRGGKLLVSAAAGSGKTKVLVDRLLSYLMDPVSPANVDDFLIITFTQAAAAELRVKIAQKLSERIAENPNNRHLQRQMQRLYMAKISTVHGFCTDLLRDNAYRMDIAADFRVHDEKESRQLRQQAFEHYMETVYSELRTDPQIKIFLDTHGAGHNDDALGNIVIGVYNKALCHTNPKGWLEWCLQQANAEMVTDVSQTIWGKYLIQQLHACLDGNIQALQNCIHAATGVDTMEPVCNLLADTVSQLYSLRECATWDAICQHPAISYGTLRFPSKCPDPQLVEQIKAIRDQCKTMVAKRRKPFADPSDCVLSDLRATAQGTQGLVKLVLGFWKTYDELKAHRRVLDFSDLEQKTLDLLLGKQRNGITAAARETAERFREIMVDEYQDTNGVQDAIFAALTNQKHNCFMVGDVKQSIYQFRLADPGIFIEKYNSYSLAENALDGQGRKVLLSKNFRSSGGVISAVNDVFSLCMSDTVGGLDYTEDEMLYEGIEHVCINEPEVELYGIEVQNDTYAEEAAFVAERISQLLDGSHMVRKGNQLRPIRGGDIAILLRAPSSNAAEFKFALENRGIRCTTGEGIDILQTEEVSTLVSLLRIIRNPLQDIPLLAVLTGKLFAFSADEIAKIRCGNNYLRIFESLQKDTSRKSKDFIEMLAQLRNESKICSVAELLDKILDRTKLMSIFYAMGDGDERCRNLQLFIQFATDYCSGGQRDLGQLLEHLDGLDEKGLVVSCDQNTEDTVTILSIHKSKGLEYPVVFLCGLSRLFSKEGLKSQILCDKELGLGLDFVDTKQRIRYKSIAKRAIAAKIKTDSISEELRILYVAMTRARDRLIMTYASKYLAKELCSYANLISLTPTKLLTASVTCPGDWILQTCMYKTEAGEFFALGGNPMCGRLSEAPWYIRTVKNDVVAQDAETVPDETDGVLPKEILERIKYSLLQRYEHGAATMLPSKQTATQIKGRDKDQEAAEHTKVFKPVDQRNLILDKKTRGTDKGNAFHRFMQFVEYDRCETVAGVSEQIDNLVQKGVLTKEQSELVVPEKITAFFSSDLGQKVRTAETVLREFKFSVLVDAQRYYPEVIGEQILLQGVVDCAIIEDDGIVVIDFKTDYVTQETVNETAERYASQVSAYTHAMERIFEKPVKRTCLYFFSIDSVLDM